MADASGTGVLRCLVIFGCVFTAMCGLALMAVSIWQVVDPHGLYPIADVSGKDDIFAGGWIAIFTGFSFFCMAVFGIFAALRKSRGWMMVYLILMVIIYVFECASCITAATHRDFLVGNSNLVKKQMLKYYADDSESGARITKTWNRVMEDVQCCGADGPLDWIEYTSTFSDKFGPVNQWPLSCCRRNSNFEVANLEACRIGHSSSIFTKGCFQHIQSKLSLYTWAVGWYGFAVLMFVFFHLVVAMIYYIKL
ncbi:hypothetical protein COCON_G00002650 [Conger conger]|uniref:Tetraspanin n=1 Tax=Conger conger TaxID=82655 RepID=A0A9Q1E0W6_CONCO|nr:hypothetical protein COCON_G00002650 [Conger conger]